MLEDLKLLEWFTLALSCNMPQAQICGSLVGAGDTRSAMVLDAW